MKVFFKNLYFISALLLFVLSDLSAQVSLNGSRLDTSLNTNDFSFVVTGHIYGGGINQSGYPASTFLANMDFIQDSLNAQFILFTGDVFQDIEHDYCW